MRLFPHFALLLAACCFICSIKLTKSVDNQTKGTEKSEDGTPSSGNGLSTLSVVMLIAGPSLIPFICLCSYFTTRVITDRMNKNRAKAAAKGDDVGVHAPSSMELRSFDFEQKDNASLYPIREITEDTPPDATACAIPSIVNYEKASTGTQPATQQACVVKS